MIKITQIFGDAKSCPRGYLPLHLDKIHMHKSQTFSNLVFSGAAGPTGTRFLKEKQIII